MAFNSVIVSSGHGLYVRGASGIIDEVDEARKFVDVLARELRHRGVDVKTYHDDVSYTQSENLNRIVDYHNQHYRDLDISVHFNAYEQVEHGMGVEVLYYSQNGLASELSLAISESGDLINRGAKQRTDLFFLSNTAMPSVMLEICFVDSEADCIAYRDNFNAIVDAVVEAISGVVSGSRPPPETVDKPDVMTGTCSSFGGPDDEGVDEDEGLAFIYEITEENQFLFLPLQPEGTDGLARRLNPAVHYCAMRFDYEKHPKDTLLEKLVLVRNPRTGVALSCVPADWGPHESTGRLIDLSPSMMRDLELKTDDTVEVIFPYAGT